MASARFDLHSHSTYSDGTLSPRELVALAADRGLSGLSLTDHDTIDGLEEAVAAAQILGLECIPGIEVSSSTLAQGEVHILGYFIDPQNAALHEMLAELAQQRVRRAHDICALVHAATGKLTYEDVLAQSEQRTPGRPHIARAMMRLGIVHSVQQAFDEWLTPGGKAYVKRTGAPLATAIDVIHRAGGVAVFAHPGARWRDGIREIAVREAVAVGLDGIEVDHPDHDDNAVRRCVELCDELSLLQTSGSDDHGIGSEGPRLGCRTVAERAVNELRARAREYRARLNG